LAGKTADGVPIPDDLVLVGHVTGAYGVQGWIRIRPYSANADAMLNARTWWLDKPALRDVEKLQAKVHGGDVVAQLMGISGRDLAEQLQGATVQVARSHFPALDKDEFYWVDLIGLDVENLEGQQLGQVADLMDNGAHPILRVVPPGEQAPDQKPQEMLIPFVDRIVQNVSLEKKKIVVDWGLDY
jgi:16S rRNA processing protein RimM